LKERTVALSVGRLTVLFALAVAHERRACHVRFEGSRINDAVRAASCDERVAIAPEGSAIFPGCLFSRSATELSMIDGIASPLAMW
jgi:hypothetical protein